MRGSKILVRAAQIIQINTLNKIKASASLFKAKIRAARFLKFHKNKFLKINRIFCKMLDQIKKNINLKLGKNQSTKKIIRKLNLWLECREAEIKILKQIKKLNYKK